MNAWRNDNGFSVHPPLSGWLLILMPPKVIGPHGIITKNPSVDGDPGRQVSFVPSGSNQPIAGHDPVHSKLKSYAHHPGQPDYNKKMEVTVSVLS